MLPFPRRTVLVVDDEKDLRDLWSIALKGAGFHVRETDDGVSALTLIEHSPPDVIVLDLRLLTLDGFSVRQEIAAHARTQHIPVIVVTGSAADASVLNVAAILRKPIEPDVLVAAVRSALGPGNSAALDSPLNRLQDQH